MYWNMDTERLPLEHDVEDRVEEWKHDLNESLLKFNQVFRNFADAIRPCVSVAQVINPKLLPGNHGPHHTDKFDRRGKSK